jgi:Fe-S-cluster containining protein
MQSQTRLSARQKWRDAANVRGPTPACRWFTQERKRPTIQRERFISRAALATMSARRKKPQRKPGAAKRLGPKTAAPSQVAHFTAADRRVHLILTRTVQGVHQLQLGRAIFEHTWQNRLALATANTAFSSLEDDFSVKSIAHMGAHALVGASSLITHLLSDTISCARGCDHCCHQRVGVTPVEAIVVALHIRATFTPADLDDLRLSLAGFVQSTRGLSAADRRSPAHACPLLKNQLCSVYDVRPLSCRGVHSFDQEACARELHDPEVRQAFLRGELPGHAFREPVQAVYAVSAGLQLALHEQFALDMRPLDLAHALDELLSGDDELAVAQKWLDGHPALLHATTDRGSQADLDVTLQQDLGLAQPR